MVDVYHTQQPHGSTVTPDGRPAAIVINNVPPKQPWLGRSLMRLLLAVSILGNLALFGMVGMYFQGIAKQETFVSGGLIAKDKIGIIDANGIITDDSVKAPIKEFENASKDDDIKGVVLRINSPGGEVPGTERLYRAVVKYQEKTKKPVVVLMDGLAASGGFWIAMPAEKIIATESTITGSIGVLMQTFVLTGLLKEWGVEAITYKTGELKDTGSFFREPTEKDKEEINSIMQATYRRFLDVILKHRAEKVGGEEKLRAVADGRILMAAVAKENGLVDEIGVLEDAIDSVKTLAGITGEVRVVRYQRQAGLAEILAPSAHANPLDRDTVLEWVTPRLLAMPAAFLPLAGATRE